MDDTQKVFASSDAEHRGSAGLSAAPKLSLPGLVHDACPLHRPDSAGREGAAMVLRRAPSGIPTPRPAAGGMRLSITPPFCH